MSEYGRELPDRTGIGMAAWRSFGSFTAAALEVHVDENGDVRRIVDKPAQSDLRCMWGCILWRPAFTEHLHAHVAAPGPTDFATIMNAAIDAGMRIRAVEFEGGGYTDVGTYEEIASLEEEYKG